MVRATELDNVIVTRYDPQPPSQPINLNGIVYNKRLNVRTGERKKWDGKRWKKEESEAIKDQQED